MLTVIQRLIIDNKWDIDYFGGEKIVDSVTGQTNTIPKGMSEILKKNSASSKRN